MANSFWTFVNRFVPGTKVKAAEANAQFDGITAGFDLAATDVSTATTAANAATAAATVATTTATSAQTTANLAQSTALAALPKAGGTMTGPIVLAGNVASALHALPKQQMDTALALKADLASPTFTGNVGVPLPSLATDAAPKGYVDSENITQNTARDALLALKANLASPAFTGTPTVPTAAGGTNTTQAASTAYVRGEVAASVAGVASFSGRTGNVTLLGTDISSTLGYTPFNPAGNLPTLTIQSGSPWVYYRDTDTAVDSSGLWRAGAVTSAFRVDRNTAVAGDFSTLTNVIEATLSTFTWMSNSIWHAGNLTNLSQLANGPGYISATSAPVQSVFGRTGAIVMGDTDITTALGYTPVQQGTGVGQTTGNNIKIGWSAGSKLKATVDSADLGSIALESWVAAQNYITTVTSSQVTTALGFTPYNATNPAGYMNNAAVNASYVAKTGSTMTGDLTMSRAASPGTGVVFLGNSGSRYLFYDGTNYHMPGTHLVVGGRLFGNSAGSGLGSIYVSAGGAPGGMNVGDLWLIY